MPTDFIDDLDLDSMLTKLNSKAISKVVQSPSHSPPSPLSLSPNQAKRLARRKFSGEDFTPPKLVNEMLDKLPESQWQEGITYCDPSVGNGNMLVEVLKRKLSYKHNPTEALKTLYGCDIMLDNIREARLRLLKVVVNHVKDNKLKKPNTLELVKILGKNIVCTPLDKYKNGSLDYDFEFKYTPTDLQAKQGLDKIVKEKLLEYVTI